jgi:ribosome-associated protein
MGGTGAKPITLAQALKLRGIASSGGGAKQLIREGLVRVNGEAETRPGRKLAAGDRIAVQNRPEWSLGE